MSKSKINANKPRIAIVDLTLHYPPQGGACVDLFSTFTRLVDRFEIQLFGVSWPSEFERGKVGSSCPLPYRIVHCPQPERDKILEALMSAIDSWAPDLVFIADGWTLKPYVARAVRSRYPIILRLYSYEMFCPRTNERWFFTNENPSIQCSKWALTEEAECLDCAERYRELVTQAKQGKINPVIEETLVADIWRGDYQEAVVDAIKSDAIIVYNSYLKELLQKHTSSSIHIVPGGVDLDTFPHCESKPEPGREFIILVFGRMGAKSKGAETAVNAGRILASRHIPFRMIITKKPEYDEPWLEEIDWVSQEKIRAILTHTCCVVVPSLWQEAFGMTWLEAMAMKVPVIVSSTAGPLDHIQDGHDGLLFRTGDEKDLAEKLSCLCADSRLCTSLAENAFEMVSRNLTWDHQAKRTGKIIETVLSSK